MFSGGRASAKGGRREGEDRRPNSHRRIGFLHYLFTVERQGRPLKKLQAKAPRSSLSLSLSLRFCALGFSRAHSVDLISLSLSLSLSLPYPHNLSAVCTQDCQDRRWRQRTRRPKFPSSLSRKENARHICSSPLCCLHVCIQVLHARRTAWTVAGGSARSD